ncbi:MAG: PQQ-binding-like beta-propeller repeat protein [Myxococcales bacterium]|nr:PQQ-binding-like beta-propeller repeat protein [Myxococcales bacterium]
MFHLAYRRLWRAPTEGLQHAVLVKDEVHLTHAHGLTAVARTTGQARWHAQGWRGLGPGAPGLALDSRGRLHRRDASARWCRPDLPPPRRVTPLHTGDWLLQHDDGLEVVDALSGAPRWAADPAYGRLLGVAQGADGLWILAEDRVLRRLSPSDGAVEIRVPLAGPPSAGPVCDGAHVWILDAQRGRHALWALGPDGGTLWRHDLGEAPLDRPRRLGDLLVVPTGDPGAPRLVALDPITGAVAWRVSIPGGPTPPRLLRAGVRVLAKGLDGSTAAFNADGGDVSWALPPDDPDGVVTHNPPPLACRGIVLVAAATVRAVDPATGRLVHTLDAGGLLPDRIDVWPDGDVLISEREGAAFFALEGHLALVG